MASAMKIGVVLQAMYIGEIVVGGISSLPRINMSQYFAIPLAMMQGGDAELAIAIAIACGVVETLITSVNNSVKSFWVHRADALVRKGKLKHAFLMPYESLILEFTEYMIIIPCACLLGADAVAAIVNSLPPFVNGILSAFVSMIPLLGFCMLLTVLVKNSLQLVFFVLGFVLFKAAGLSVMTIVVIACAIAYILFLTDSKKGEIVNE